MTASSPIRSAAQLSMMERASTDADYAKSRGITHEAAQALLDGHKAAGSPKLAERVESMNSAPSRPKSRAYRLLGAH